MYSGKSGCFRENGSILVKVVVSGQSGYWGKNGSIRAKVVVLEKKWLNPVKNVFGQIWLYSGKVVVFEKNLLCFVNTVDFGQKWLYWGKVILIWQSGYIRAKWLYSGKVVVFGQKWLYSGKVVVFGQKWF